MRTLYLFAAFFLPPSLVSFSSARNNVEVGVTNLSTTETFINGELFTRDDVKYMNDSAAPIGLEKRQDDQTFEVLDTYDPPFKAVGKVGHYCTGAIISQNGILTSAHCARLSVDVGFTLTGRVKGFDPIITQNLPIKEVFTFPVWEGHKRAKDDIAIIQLQDNVADHIAGRNCMNMPTKSVLQSGLMVLGGVTILSFPFSQSNKMYRTRGVVTQLTDKSFKLRTEFANDGALVYDGSTNTIHGVISKYIGPSEDRTMSFYSVTVLTKKKIDYIEAIRVQIGGTTVPVQP